ATAVLFLCALALLPANAQQVVTLPRADSPLTLFGFEGAGGTSGWGGLPCSLTSANYSEGTQAMSFTMPQYFPGGSEWPLVYIDFAGGNGYATNDWSHYALVSFDAWTDSTEPEDLALELRDVAGVNGWATHYTILPGQKNTITVPLTDVNEVVDVANIQEVIFYTTRPSHDYKVTVDNFLLLPGVKPPLAEFNLVYPNYRDLIFPTAANIKAAATVQTAEYGVSISQIGLVATATAGSSKVVKRSGFSSAGAAISIPTRNLPYGQVSLTVSVVNLATGAALQTQTWSLSKLNQTQANARTVYVDANNNTIVNGKPFFPLGWYNSTSDQYMYEIADSPFNCVLDYCMNHVPKDQMLQYLNKANEAGLKVIYCMNDVYPTATYIDSWEGITGNDQITQAVVQAYKNHPAVLAWYLNDERPKSLAPQLEGYYQSVAANDPNHPCYIVLCNMPEVKYFTNTTDIMGVDPYPVPSSPLTTVSDWTDTAQSAVKGKQPVWMVLQAFAWYQYSSSNPDRGHIPTPEELATGRAPTYAEDRCMTYLALTQGAKGIIYYCYYDLRVLPQYQEMWTGMKSIAAEVKTLSPMLLSPSDLGAVTYSPSSANIHTKLKQYNGQLYLMAVNPDSTACTVTFNLRNKLTYQTTTMFENGRRPIFNVRQGTLTDTFQPQEVHVYNLGKSSLH
ncbi:MAG TPA: hypothetical protein VGK34_01335, partial [Armatimonadota bacterium]